MTHGFGALAVTTFRKVNGGVTAATTSAVTTTAGVGLAGVAVGFTTTQSFHNGHCESSGS